MSRRRQSCRCWPLHLASRSASRQSRSHPDLEAVSARAVEAAIRAAEQASQADNDVRLALSRQLEEARHERSLASRRYEMVDPPNAWFDPCDHFQVQKPGLCRRIPQNRVGKNLIDIEKPYCNFRDWINVNRPEINNLLKRFKRDGKRIHVWGLYQTQHHFSMVRHRQSGR
jgi:hypothetical protein